VAGTGGKPPFPRRIRRGNGEPLSFKGFQRHLPENGPLLFIVMHANDRKRSYLAWNAVRQIVLGDPRKRLSSYSCEVSASP